MPANCPTVLQSHGTSPHQDVMVVEHTVGEQRYGDSPCSRAELNRCPAAPQSPAAPGPASSPHPAVPALGAAMGCPAFSLCPATSAEPTETTTACRKMAGCCGAASACCQATLGHHEITGCCRACGCCGARGCCRGLSATKSGWAAMTKKHSVTKPNYAGSAAALQGHLALAETKHFTAVPIMPVQPFQQCVPDTPTPPAAARAPGLPPPGAHWSGSETVPSAQPLQGGSSCPCNSGAGPEISHQKFPEETVDGGIPQQLSP